MFISCYNSLYDWGLVHRLAACRLKGPLILLCLAVTKVCPFPQIWFGHGSQLLFIISSIRLALLIYKTSIFFSNLNISTKILKSCITIYQNMVTDNNFRLCSDNCIHWFMVWVNPFTWLLLCHEKYVLFHFWLRIAISHRISNTALEFNRI